MDTDDTMATERNQFDTAGSLRNVSATSANKSSASTSKSAVPGPSSFAALSSFKQFSDSANAGATNYIATSHWSTAIAASVVGSFESADCLNLVVAKKNVLSISKVASAGVTCATEIPVFGNIIRFDKVRPKWSGRDLLLAFTSSFDLLVMAIEQLPGASLEAQYEVRLLAQGNARERARSESEAGFSFAVDPTQQYIAMHIYSGEVKIIKLPEESLAVRQQLSQTELYMHTLRVEEENVIDMCFMDSLTDDPVLAFIYNDSSGRHLVSYTVKLADELLERWSLDVKSIEHEANSIISLKPNPNATVRNPGVLVIGQESVMYANQSRDVLNESLSDVAHCRVTCHCVLDDAQWPARYLIGEGAQGHIMLLVVYKDNPHSDKVTKMQITKLGHVSCTPYELRYVDSGRVFVGTEDGDSYLIRLTDERDPVTRQYFTIETVYPGLGPVLDLQVVQHEQSQAYLLACTGRRRTGTLRIIRNGVGIEERANMEDMGGARGVWAISLGYEPTGLEKKSNGLLNDIGGGEMFHDTIVLSHALDTKIISMNAGEAEDITETGFEGLATNLPTLWCANIGYNSDFIVQVTEVSVRTMRRSTRRLVDEWLPPSAASATGDAGVVGSAAHGIRQCAVFENQAVVACGSQLIYMEIDTLTGAIKSLATSMLAGDDEAACIDILPVGTVQNNNSSSRIGFADCAAVGTWTTQSLRIYGLPEMNHLVTEDLSQWGMVPRSVKICSVDDNTTYIMVSLGDGTIHYFSIDARSGKIGDRKRIALGTQPTQMYRFDVNYAVPRPQVQGLTGAGASGGANASYMHRQGHIFACSDRPAIIYYSSNSKLIFANVNVGRPIRHVCSFNSPEFPNSLIMVDDAELVIGEIDQIQKLHIRTIGLHYHARRLVYSKSDNIIAICGIQEHWQAEEDLFLPSTFSQQVRKPAADTAATAADDKKTVKEEDAEEVDNDIAVQDGLGAGDGVAPGGSSAAVVVPATSHGVNGVEPFGCFIKFYDGTTYDEKATFTLQERELINTITTCRFGEHGPTYYAIGTGFTTEDELECASGRIVLLHYRDGIASVMAQKDVQGAVYVLREFQNKLAATVNNTLFIFEWDPNSQDMKTECMKTLSVQAIHMKVKNDFIVIGDLMRSIIVYAYRHVEGTIEEVAQDFYPTWMSACEIIDDDLFIGATDEDNIFVVRSDTSAESQDDRVKLKRVAIINLGDRITQFCHGSLAMPQQESNIKYGSPILFGTTSGAIGVILQLHKPLFDFLKQLETTMADSVKVVGRMKHQQYREYRTRGEPTSTYGFVDGDLVERFLDLTVDEQREIVQLLTLDPSGVAGVLPTLDEAVKVVEDMSRLH